MKFLGIGPIELILIILVAILVLGPEGIVNASRKAGKTIRDLKKSNIWQVVQDSKKSMSNISKDLVAETGLDDLKDEISDLNEMRNSGMVDIKKELSVLNKVSDEEELS